MLGLEGSVGSRKQKSREDYRGVGRRQLRKQR